MNRIMTATAASLLSGMAFAADLPSRSAPAPVFAVSAPSWTGFYLGAGVGWAGYSGDWVTTAIGNPPINPALVPRLGLGGASATFDSDSFRGVLFAGYNYQASSSIVLGLEADIGFGSNDKQRLNYFREQSLERWGPTRRLEISFPFPAGGTAAFADDLVSSQRRA